MPPNPDPERPQNFPREAHGHAPPQGRWPWLPMVGVGLAIVGGILLSRLANQLLPVKAPPVMVVVGRDLAATERSGASIKLSSLQGKVTVMGCLYTVCPHGCAALVGQMRKLNDRYRNRADFHQVSLAVAPERDTPAFLASYADGVGVNAKDPWWFITGLEQEVWDYMTYGLKMQEPKLIPEEKRLNPMDFYEHDLRLVLLDRRGRVRGYYAVFHPQPEVATMMIGQLEKDVQLLLEHPEL